ncbi:hypothetical protein FMM54_00225 [Campylobacter sp. LR185c]|uniref:hypothetical protein n=1 Tax=Campylobacter sp. LR185c TaxID=2014525 RepID=UPI001237FBD8|nr:hypothetical protein [Campylobacter sp. LR185c]KAA6228638.1 hypothetical protein FMM54_00225 [Campylobacter sp. LR185c]KAA8604263.1 hypothetical protein CGP82_03480 [Campylobacter sp. LR185c]
MKKDYGTWLLEKGVSKDEEVNFHQVPLDLIGISGPNSFVFMVETDGNEEEYGIAFSFDENILNDLIIIDESCENKINELKNGKIPNVIKLDKTITIPLITANIGEEIQNEEQVFVPLVIKKISKA